MGNYVGNDAQNSFSLLANGVSDIAWSSDEKTLFAATNDGKIKVFNVATHALVTTWNIGQSLGALSISDDGKTLVAGGTTLAGDAVVYAINTGSGTKTVFKPAVAGVGDVEIVDNRHVIVSGNGSNQTLTLDLATGQFGTLPGSVNYSANSTLTEDEHLTLFGESGISNGPLFLYDDRTGTIVAAGDNYQGGASSGFNFGIQAVSEKAGVVLQFNYYNGVNIYDLKLKAVKHIALGDGPAIGYDFAPDGKSVYVYFTSGLIEQFSLANWSSLATFSAPTASWGSGGFGNAIRVSADGNYISVYDSSSGSALTLIDLTSRNEVFKGTTGADTFAGGLGNDTYTVNNVGDIVTEYRLGGNDKVLSTISHTLRANVEALQLAGTAAIDGTGNSLDNVITGNAGINTLDGAAGNDTVIGIGGGDILRGGLGNDTLISGIGIDQLIGGAGNDTYIVNDMGDMIVEDVAGGLDTVQTGSNYSLLGAAENVENVTLTGQAISATGNGLANTITGNLGANTLDGDDGDDKLFGLSGGDTLLGGAGNDLLDGGIGADTMTGGAGNDTYLVDYRRDIIIEDSGTGGGIDTVIASISWTLADGTENLVLAPGDAAIDGTGNAGANTITGNAGANVIDGGAGADRMLGGLGNDTYIVDNRGDRITEVAINGGYDKVQSSITTTLAANVEMLVLTGSAAINGTGNLSANTIIGNDAANVLDGRGIDTFGVYDMLYGGLGNDTYVLSQIGVTQIFENAGEGTDRVISSISYGQLDANVENLVLTGTAALTGGGNELANAITGNSGANILYGYDGNDTLTGGDGNDQLLGGVGDDVLVGDAGNDYLYGNSGSNVLKGGAGNDAYYVGEGTDRIIELAGEGDRDVIFSNVSVTMPQNVEVIQLTGDALINAAGNDQNNAIYGNQSANLLNGLGGDDVLADFGGNDTLTGGTGADIFDFITTFSGATSVISDFNEAENDIIRVRMIDANAFTQGDEAFRFIGTAAFSGTFGELRYQQIGANTIVTGDVNGDRTADFTIQVNGLHTLDAADFVL